MRVPNGLTCVLSDNMHASMMEAGSVLRRCDEEFEASAGAGALVRFETTDADMEALAALYPEIETATRRLKDFLNCVIFMQLKMPYEIATMVNETSERRFVCRMRRELPIFD